MFRLSVDLLAVSFSASTLPSYAEDMAPAPTSGTIVDGLDLGPLAKLVGTWKTEETGGVDVAPGQAQSPVGKGGVAVEPYYEVFTFEPAAGATNASDQSLTALYYKQEVFRKKDGAKFHDQRGYLIYDKKNDVVYNSFCIPRAVCVVAEGKAGDVMTLETKDQGIAESNYMLNNDNTLKFSIDMDFSKDKLQYSQTTNLNVYGKPFAHKDTSTLKKVS